MILADKIISLRKKAGWSQEDLAEKLGVTRQSVSKWEGAQSVPDMDKVVQMSRLFGVSTDFLLKDELEEETPPRPRTTTRPCAASPWSRPPTTWPCVRPPRPRWPGRALCVISPGHADPARRNERGAALPYQRKRGGGHRIVRDAGAAGCRGEHFPARRRGRARLPLFRGRTL